MNEEKVEKIIQGLFLKFSYRCGKEKNHFPFKQVLGTKHRKIFTCK